ncbi:MAG TPA: hypothetical protein VJ951_04015, partial [Bacteroidales bacterium]|nr:hypothetical protein [Bacteroidales bacterium]
KKSRLYVNASYMVNIAINSSADFMSVDDFFIRQLDLKSRNHLVVGVGYSYKEKYSLELRYQAPHEILDNYFYWDTNYKTMSIILGYSLF